jgi:hypothetical protein
VKSRTVVLVSLLLVGCGSQVPTNPVRDGAVLYRDALRNNHGSWVVGGGAFFADGRYHWRRLGPGVDAMPDALPRSQIPAGVATSVGLEVTEGAALSVLTCRTLGPVAAPPQDWYELGVDGRWAMIRRMAERTPPRVLARAKVPVANGRHVRLTAACVDDGNGLVLTLRLDGREVVRARDGDPLPPTRDGLPGTVDLRAYPRPDSRGPASITWDDFEVRSASLAQSSG